MIRKLFALFWILSGLALAQNTVTGTIQDANGNRYANGTASAATVPVSGQPTIATTPIPTSSTGFFSLSLASNTYIFTICAPPTNIGPLGNPTPKQICFSSQPIVVNSSVDLSTTLNPLATLLGPSLGSGGGIPGGANTQIQFNNSGVFGGLNNVAAGSVLASQGVGSSPTFQNKPIIDVRDTPGLDCTGASDSSTALNTIFSSIQGKKVIIPSGCVLRANSQVQILNQTNFIIEAQGSVPNQSLAAAEIFGCGTGTGAVLYINRSSVGVIRGLGVYAKGNGCSSAFTQSVRVDNSGVSGFTSTNILFDSMAVGTSEGGGAIANYVGFAFVGTPNMEQMRVTHSDIQCQFSTNSFGVWYSGANADVGEVSSSGIGSCFQAIRVDSGNPRVAFNLLGNNGGYTHFGNNNQGAVIFVGACTSGPMTIIGNEQSSGGPFINSNDQSGLGCSRLVLIGNNMGADDLQNGAFVVNAGTVGGFTYLEGNNISTLANPNVTGVGSNSQGASGPLGSLFSIANTSDAGLGYTTQEWQSGMFNIAGQASTSAVSSLSTSLDTTLFQNQQVTTGRSPVLNFQTFTNQVDNYTIASIPTKTTGVSTLVLAHPSNNPPTTPAFAIDGPIGGVISTSSLNSPGALQAVVPTGGTGGTTWAYAVVGISGNGACHTAVSPTTTINNGVASLSTSSLNQVQWFPDQGIVYYNIYRITAGGTPNTTGKIGRLYVTQMANNLANGLQLNFNDTGLTGDGTTAPATNTCIGSGSFTGNLIFSANKGQHINTQAAANDISGTCTAAAAATCTVTFTTAYTSAPSCTVTDQTNITTLKALPSTTNLVITTSAASSDVFSYICAGNPN